MGYFRFPLDIPKLIGYSRDMIKCVECKAGPLKGGMFVGNKGPLCNACVVMLQNPTAHGKIWAAVVPAVERLAQKIAAEECGQ